MLPRLKGGPVKIKVFLGEHQSNVPLETARARARNQRAKKLEFLIKDGINSVVAIRRARIRVVDIGKGCDLTGTGDRTGNV